MTGARRRNRLRAATLLCSSAILFACGAGRFKDQPVIWRVHDTRSIAEPEERPFDKYSLGLDWFITRRLTRALELPDKEPAHDTNALDEVPDSTWFQNRIGVRNVTPAEAVRGTGGSGPPQAPLIVVSGKSGGANPGFLVKDARGVTFVVKFDTLDNPEMQTATGVIVNRIFWALGYHVPNDTLFYFARSELRLAPGATKKNDLKQKLPMTWDDVEEALATSPRLSDGRYRAFASEFLKGKPLGGFSAEGVRDDDPNDTIPHEHRREVRALRVFAAWTGHTDMKEDNTLDMYVEENGKRFIRHYLIDFGEALGAHQAEKRSYEDGYEHAFDWERQGRAAVSFGLWKRPWEDQTETPWLSIGAFSAEHFDPVYWREAYPYFPFFELDAADAFWAAKLVMRFTRPVLEAIVAEGRLSHPAAARYLVNALVERQHKIGLAYLEALTPLDHFTLDRNALCAVDLGVRHGLANYGVVAALDADGEVLQRYTVDRSGRVCIPVTRDEDYRYYRLRIERGAEHKPPLQVHFKSGARPRILGIVREEP
jgi:hypothetical protein